MSAHTPGPWFVGPHYRYDVESPEGRICACSGIGSPRSIANAEFIVRACNSHDDLLAALKELVATLQREAPGTPLNNRRFDALGIKAHAAIAKAEGR